MQNRKLHIMTTLMLTAVMISGCSAIASIFEAGFWAGLVVAIIVILIIWAIVKKLRQ